MIWLQLSDPWYISKEQQTLTKEITEFCKDKWSWVLRDHFPDHKHPLNLPSFIRFKDRDDAVFFTLKYANLIK